MICTDTSFLISLYGNDVNSPEAKRLWSAASQPVVVHALNDFEFGNALRLLAFRQIIQPQHMAAWLANCEADKAAGLLLTPALDMNAVLRHALRLSTTHSQRGGHRGFDIFLTAAALELGATHLWSFDTRQRQLAAAEGLAVLP